MSDIIYKIIRQPDWAAFQADGVYHGSDVDLADGFIHFSTRDQLAQTLALHYAGQTGLILLAVDSAVFDSQDLKWEEARNGQLFPHLYASMPITSVRSHWPLKLQSDGTHQLPKSLS